MRCEACPVAGMATARPCPGESHGLACDDIRRGLPGRAEQLYRVATGNEPPRTSAETAYLMAAVDAEFCPHGSGPCGCGTGPPRLCGHPARPIEVRRPFCIECTIRSGWESGVDPTF